MLKLFIYFIKYYLISHGQAHQKRGTNHEQITSRTNHSFMKADNLFLDHIPPLLPP